MLKPDWWADGIYFNVRLDEERTCVLVLIGATEDGIKELIAVVDGYRESAQSWRELLQQLKRLGLSTAPKLAIGDGSLGFWIALQENMVPWPSSAAGCIRRLISWIKCRRALYNRNGRRQEFPCVVESLGCRSGFRSGRDSVLSRY